MDLCYPLAEERRKTMPGSRIHINRAPVLTLWASIVAERLGHNEDLALTLGKAVAGLNAQSKGRRLGIYAEKKAEQGEAKSTKRPEPRFVQLLGRSVPVTRTAQGMRALSKDAPVTAESVRHYLQQKFGEDLPRVREALEALAAAYEPGRLEAEAYALYENFRPSVPEGKQGWGAKGELDLDKIRALAR